VSFSGLSVLREGGKSVEGSVSQFDSRVKMRGRARLSTEKETRGGKKNQEMLDKLQRGKDLRNFGQIYNSRLGKGK